MKRTLADELDELRRALDELGDALHLASIRAVNAVLRRLLR